SLYVGAYTARSSVDSMLVGLRRFLAEHGVQRRCGVHEPEDHIAMLFEIMRFLIHEQLGTVDEQKRF
ncbi:MAG: molecular chaperone, partial [Burkholderiales bacterium]|nr:molecular chaperone [Burkholderiales bacterium]